MKTKYFEDSLTYTGKELKSLFIFNHFNLQGNALIAFQGPCDVKLHDMVDQEDVKANAPIYSPCMLHFLGEFFEMDLEKMIFRQRLLIACMLEKLKEFSPQFTFKRKGDDLFVHEKKLSVSIATKSPVSTLLHAGLNVLTDGTPVPTFGLKEANINPVTFAQEILKEFNQEITTIEMARCKVRGVN